MPAPCLGAIVLNLLVALWRTLRRQQVRPSGRSTRYVEIQIQAVAGEVRQRKSAADHGIRDFVLELQVAEAKTVGPLAGGEIGARDGVAYVVFRLIHLQAVGIERPLSLDLRVAI